jgi:FkbM family methyltransferase
MDRHFTGVRLLRALARRVVGKFKPQPEFFLKKVSGVVHIGANRGQERDVYAAHDLNVLWIEPIPEVFCELRKRIASTPKQSALCQLVTDVDEREYSFHISNNQAESSSIFDLAQHKELWPDVFFTKSITLKSATLSSLVKREFIDLSKYDALVMDTQGSELLILKGAVDVLPAFRFIRTEVPDFAAYRNCCQLSDMDEFLGQHGFCRVATSRFARKAGVGSYFDVTYANCGPSN